MQVFIFIHKLDKGLLSPFSDMWLVKQLQLFDVRDPLCIKKLTIQTDMTDFSPSIPYSPYSSASPGVVHTGDCKHEVGEAPFFFFFFALVGTICFHLSEHVACYTKLIIWKV